MDEQFTPDEKALIERLEKVRLHRLSPGKIDAIQERILAAADLPIRAFRFRPTIPTVVSAVAVTAATIILIFFLIDSRSPSQQPATTIPLAERETALPATKSTSVPNTTSAATLTASQQPLATGQQATEQSTPNIGKLPGNIVVVEGPVRDIHANLVTIYDFKVQLQPDDPMLTILNVGDFARVKGNLDDHGVLVAAEVSNNIGVAVGGGSALISGRVQAINGNIVTINGIRIELKSGDPRLTTIHVGAFLSVTGNFERQGTIVVLVVINVIVVNDVDVQNYLDCLKHRGMAAPPPPGMGGDAMGMAAPPPPGMGGDAMGMAAPPPPGMGSPGCG